MKKEYREHLNELLVTTLNSIRKTEEDSLRKRHQSNLSISEYHLLEAVGTDRSEQAKTVSEIAGQLQVTNASATVAINKLVKKGFLTKQRCDEDGRVVFVLLTREGRRINAGHRLFHQHMITEISKEFTEEELDILLRCIERINNYFRRD